MTTALPRRTTRATATLAVAASATVALTACSTGTAATSDGEADTTLTVFAAASLTAAFDEIAMDFEADHPGVEVRLSLAGSSNLVAQVQQGAPADVVATADTATMNTLVADELVGTPQAFATNTLEIAVPAGNPAGIADLQDLTDPTVNLVVCAPEVPCGAATTAVVDHAGLTLQPVSEEQSVTDVLGKVSAGEADAGLVYVTDVARAGDQVEGIAFDESDAAVNTYPIATVDRTGQNPDQADLAQQFVDAVLSPDSQAVLAHLGFTAP
ncbi:MULTISPECIES: molybdate ABC transporter substrate-binding protein [unclassified Isoptericola]|uniref:molybdate ABC transporter substrate-binding protein n=1 Tax=unclassified Isoptericola TaxID=2623355 RepID=UPI002712B382|nr:MULTISPECIES: molybdate ABC transporter substrate-binding protein [unclassified Isoptericola]MDO8146836.1 molybdate ABC transporter substrate-binding protein [Isoptericola sp. b515]MDO8150849.1 molybdate ABC transporter substrate-binding protein [Isoptericola sp. b408]